MPSKRPQVNVRMKREDHERLERLAIARRRTPTDMARVLVLDALDAVDGDKAAARV
jgi:hypothetical protein